MLQQKRIQNLAAAVLAVACVSACAVSACTGVPTGPNKRVCVRLSSAADTGCGPTGWPLPSGPSQGFWYETDDGSDSGANQWVRNATFRIDTPGGTIAFEMVDRADTGSGGNSGGGESHHDDTNGFACHAFAIISRTRSTLYGGGCSREVPSVSCAYGAQAGVSGPVPAQVAGQVVTLKASANLTYGFQSLDDTYMGGTIVVTNQLAPSANGGGSTTGGVSGGDDDDSHGDSVRRGAMIAAIVIGICAFVLLPAALGLRYARRTGMWSGVCDWKRNPNLAAAPAASSSSSTAAPATTLSEVALDVHSGGSGSAVTNGDVSHVRLRDDAAPSSDHHTPAVTTAGYATDAGAHGAAVEADGAPR